MNMIIRKRQLVTGTLVIALGAAVFVNWYYTKPQKQSIDAGGITTQYAAEAGEAGDLGDAQYVIANGDETGMELFAESELNRSKAHDEAAELLNNVIKDEGSSESAIKEATQKLTEMSELIKIEADAETLITAKTNSDCLVILDGESAQVIVPPEVLDDTVTIQIKDIIVNKTGLSSKNITIIELKG